MTAEQPRVSLHDFFEARPQIKRLPWMKDRAMSLVTSVEHLKQVIDECIEAKLYALDLEATGVDVRVFDGQTVTKIVGACFSPDGKKAYYVPLRHRAKSFEGNIPWSVFNAEMLRLIESKAVAIFHNGKYDQELLQFNGGTPLGLWDSPKVWDDSLIMAYLYNSRELRKGLKALSAKYLNQQMIELKDLFGEGHTGPLDFSLLNPTWDPVVWYGCCDVLCTYDLYVKYHPLIHGKETDGQTLKTIYSIEKMAVPAARWAERPRLQVDREKVLELLEIGQKEYVEALDQIYVSATEILGRDIMPQYFKRLKEDFVATEPINNQIELAKGFANLSTTKDPTETIPKTVSIPQSEISPFLRLRPDDRMAWLRKILGVDATSPKKLKDETRAVIQSALFYWPAKDGNRGEAIGLAANYKIAADEEGSYNAKFPPVYDIKSQQQLGTMFKEMGVPHLTRTASGIIATSKKVVEDIVEGAAGKFPWMAKVKRFRETEKAISSYLVPLLEDVATDGSLKINYNAHRIETGRYCTPGTKKPKENGGTRLNMHGMPNRYNPNRPECMNRLRECFVARPGKFMVAIDYDGVELRIIANISKEEKWISAYFECSDCKTPFDRGVAGVTPEPPPPFCPKCGSDKIGDLHSMTALEIYGADARERSDWKQLRQNAKGTNFGLSYGGGPSAVQRSTGVHRNEAVRIKRKYDSSYPILKRWWVHQHGFVKQHGFVRTAFARKYPLPDINDDRPGFVAAAQRNAVNGPIQGSSADITKLAMALVYKLCKKKGWLDKVHMLVTLHDELVFEIDEDILLEAVHKILHVMTSNKPVLNLKWPVPLTAGAEVGRSWAAEWDLRKILAGKASVPEALQPAFAIWEASKKDKDQEGSGGAPSGGAPSGGAGTPGPTGKELTSAFEQVDMGTPTAAAVALPNSRAGSPYIYRLTREIDLQVISDLADLIHKVGGSGVSPLRLETRDGRLVPYPVDQDVLVSPAVWLGAAMGKGW